MKRFLIISVILLWSIFVLFCVSSIAETTGEFEFGITENSVTDLQKIDTALNMEIDAKPITANIAVDFAKQQTDEQLTDLTVDIDLQGNYFMTDKIYGFGSYGYQRDIHWWDDFTDIGAGIGYKVPDKFLIQSGLYWATIYYPSSEYDRQALSKTKFQGRYEFNEIFSLKEVAEYELNLEEVHAFNSIFNDYRISSDTALIADLTDSIFLKVLYSWRHIRNVPEAAPGDQKEYGLKLGVRL